MVKVFWHEVVGQVSRTFVKPFCSNTELTTIATTSHHILPKDEVRMKAITNY